MEKNEIVRFIQGLQKKHGASFSVKIKYLTNTGKVQKRHGEFVDFINDDELVLFNKEKNSQGRYQLERIREISKF